MGVRGPGVLLSGLGEARRMLGTRRRRTILSGLGVILAATMLSAAVTIADGLGKGFDRAARRADLGDLIVRFDPESASKVASRIGALPDLSGYALRTEVTSVGVAYGSHSASTAVAEVIGSGRRQGFAVTAGHGFTDSSDQVLVEAAWARAWGIGIGDQLHVQGLGSETVVGYAEGPDDVGYPLAAPRFYLSRAQITRRFGPEPDPQVNFAEVWLKNPAYINEVLVQARDESYGLRNLQFATRAGVQVLIGQAAGLVIDLLVALSAIALATAAVLLAASARAEVQRRLRSIGIRRAVGATRRHVTLLQALEAGMVALPAATLGTLIGYVATGGPGDRLLALLNQPPPGSALILPLLGVWLISLAIPVLGAAWPAWSAAGRGVITLLRGADVAPRRNWVIWRRLPAISLGRGTRGRKSTLAVPFAPAGATRVPARGNTGPTGGGLVTLGARLVAARRARLAATVTMLTCSVAFVLLLIALAATLNSLATDPQELGKKYQLTASAPAAESGRIARLPGVAAAAPRYEVHAVDGYALGELIDVIAYPGNHTIFEAPPLASGHRLHGHDEAEVGVGLANALGLAPGVPLLMELPNGRQLSLTVSGTVDSLDYQGLVAYVPAAALLRADPSAPSQIAVLVKPGASQTKVSTELTRLGVEPATAAGAIARGAPLVAVLKTILIAVAVVDGLVCLYALVQACALTMQERRRTVAVLRACGASSGAIRRLLGGAVFTLIIPAAVVGILLQWLLLGPALSRLAAGYATLDLSPSPLQILAVLAGLGVAGSLAVVLVTRGAVRESVVRGLAG